MKQNIKNRIYLFLVALITFLVVGKFIYESLKDSTVYFFSPSELYESTNKPKQLIRVGGMVKKNSLKKEDDSYVFIITDYKKEINVIYKGIKPNLFVEGQGAVVEGKLKTRNSLVASKILAKHDENYMPKEVADALKKSGDWNKKYGK